MANAFKISILASCLFLAGCSTCWGKGAEDGAVPAAPAESAMCSMDAMICPDGSAVGRTGPDCAFAACPGAAATSSSSPVTPAVPVDGDSDPSTTPSE